MSESDLASALDNVEVLRRRDVPYRDSIDKDSSTSAATAAPQGNRIINDNFTGF